MRCSRALIVALLCTSSRSMASSRNLGWGQSSIALHLSFIPTNSPHASAFASASLFSAPFATRLESA